MSFAQAALSGRGGFHSHYITRYIFISTDLHIGTLFGSIDRRIGGRDRQGAWTPEPFENSARYPLEIKFVQGNRAMQE